MCQIPWQAFCGGMVVFLAFMIHNWFLLDSFSVLDASLPRPFMSLPYVPHPVIEQDLIQALTANKTFGALVYWLPSGGGKSTSLYHVAASLKKQGYPGVILHAEEKLPDNLSIQDWVLNQLGVKQPLPPGTHGIGGALKKFHLKKPSFLVIDHFDDFHYHAAVKEFVTNTAADSYETETCLTFGCPGNRMGCRNSNLERTRENLLVSERPPYT
jgi:hypothetical protein